MYKDEVGGLEPLVLELSESDGEDSQLQTFIKAFNKDEQVIYRMILNVFKVGMDRISYWTHIRL